MILITRDINALRGRSTENFIEKLFFLKTTFFDYFYAKFTVDFDYDSYNVPNQMLIEILTSPLTSAYLFNTASVVIRVSVAINASLDISTFPAISASLVLWL